jgi:hypothetical protein
VDLFRKRYEEGSQFLDELSKFIGMRYFQMQRYLWTIEDKQEDKLQAIEAEYFKTVMEWNSTMWVNRNKVRLLVGEAHANRFLDYQDDRRTDNPLSIQYRFAKAHRYVIDAKEGKLDIYRAQAEVTQLNWACSEFLESLTMDFLKRAASLELLDVPKDSTYGDDTLHER